MTYNALSQYKQNSILTATPEELTLMLYNGAIKFINKAKISIENKDIKKSHEFLIRAQDIIIELNSSLNMKYEVSKNLRNIYDFILQELIDANMKKDIKFLDEVMGILVELRDTWKQAMKIAKKERNISK